MAADATTAGLVANWTFSASPPSTIARLARVKSVLTGLRRAPASSAIRALTPRSRWTCYFIYLPDGGGLTAAHRFTLQRLRALEGGLAVVCATPTPVEVPLQELADCDALYWKGLSGYDFSAYALAVRETAQRSPGADLLMLNDSVLGPFDDLDRVLASAPWAMTGFTAWASFEPHVQSYAWRLRSVTPDLVRGLRSVLPSHVAFDRFQQVVNCQETRFARVAASTMSVGALWYEPSISAGDPSLGRAVALLGTGFPFLKRSLAGGRLAARADQQVIRTLLEARGHPYPA